MKKRGIATIILGTIMMSFGIWMLQSSSPFDYWGHSSGMRTSMEFAPWFFIMLGAFGILAGIFYLIQGSKPLIKKQAKIIEKNGNQITMEFYDDGSRKTLIPLGNIALVVGDVGIVGIKGKFIVEFTKTV